MNLHYFTSSGITNNSRFHIFTILHMKIWYIIYSSVMDLGFKKKITFLKISQDISNMKRHFSHQISRLNGFLKVTKGHFRSQKVI